MSVERFLSYMTWPEVKALDKTDAVAVIPVGATEQHGRHLPIYTDTIISSGVLERAMAPQLVKEDKAKPCFPNFPDSEIGLSGPSYAAWKTEDWSSTGVFGDPTRVIDEIAADYLERAVTGTVRFIEEMVAFEYDRPTIVDE